MILLDVQLQEIHVRIVIDDGCLECLGEVFLDTRHKDVSPVLGDPHDVVSRVVGGVRLNLDSHSSHCIGDAGAQASFTLG